MRDEQESKKNMKKELAHNLSKVAEYRRKAEAATDARMKAAFQAVAREFLARARALDPELSLNGTE